MTACQTRSLRIIFIAAMALGAGCRQQTSGFLVTDKPLDVGIPSRPICIAVSSDIPPHISYWDPGADCSIRNSSVGVAQVVSVSKPDPTSLLVSLRFAQHAGEAEVLLRVTPSSVRCLGSGAEQTARMQKAIPPEN
jgi:hypothetical protein